MTLETSTADAAPTRRSRRRPSAPSAAEAFEVPTGTAETDATPALAEAVLAVGITAAIAQVHAEQPPLTRAELRRRRAAEAGAPAPEPEPVAAPLEAPLPETSDVVYLEVVDAADAEPTPPADAARTAAEAADAPGATFISAVTDDPAVDFDFDFAAQLFSFTGKTPVQVAAEAVDQAEAADAASATPAAPAAAQASARTGFRRLATMSFSIGVMGAVGLLAVGTTTPASVAAAFTEPSADIAVIAPAAITVEDDEIQAYVAASDTAVRALDRPEPYDIASMADIAADSGVTQFAGTWVNDPSADIQWPFPVGVPVSAAYGSSSYLSQFSSPHRGVDLTPGAGAAIHVIADGTVRIATQAGGDYGVTVLVDHVIDGQQVSTRYAHMEYGSLRVSAGDTVGVGDVVGTVGSTGKATGAHLHFEVLINGTSHTDPYAWMREHTTS